LHYLEGSVDQHTRVLKMRSTALIETLGQLVRPVLLSLSSLCGHV